MTYFSPPFLLFLLIICLWILISCLAVPLSCSRFSKQQRTWSKIWRDNERSAYFTKTRGRKRRSATHMFWIIKALTDWEFYLFIYLKRQCTIYRLALTLMSILPCRLWGLGSVLDPLLRTSPTSSLSPKISRRYWAIFFCCWMLQWFSMDRITGNLSGKKTLRILIFP